MTEAVPSPPRSADSYWLTRFVMLRLLGCVYAVAFLVAAKQILPLIGSHGLLPLDLFLARVQDAIWVRRPPVLSGCRRCSGSPIRTPFCNWRPGPASRSRASSWPVTRTPSSWPRCGRSTCRSSTSGQDWYGYGWEIQLLETGFLAIFLCPLLDGRPFPKREPPVVVLWLFRWLIFRIMLGAALIKLRGDSCWRDLTALYYHFETQPIPNPLSRWFHFLPHWMLKAGVLFNFLAELIAPWFAFYPRMARRIAGVIMVSFQFIAHPRAATFPS